MNEEYNFYYLLRFPTNKYDLRPLIPSYIYKPLTEEEIDERSNNKFQSSRTFN